MEIPILFEDANYLALNKPPLVVVLPTVHYPQIEQTVAGFIAHHLGLGIKDVGKPERFGLVHRLDRDTSGVLVVGKNGPTWDFLTQQFEHHKVHKEYLAMVWGRVDLDEVIGRYNKNPHLSGEPLKIDTTEGWLRVTSKLNRNPQNTQKFMVSNHGGEAETLVQVIGYYRLTLANSQTESLTLLRVQPKSGRTHQIRVHLSELGYPIVGDWLYGGRKHYRWVKDKLNRQFLHSQKIIFPLLDGGGEKEIVAPLWGDLVNFLKVLSPG